MKKAVRLGIMVVALIIGQTAQGQTDSLAIEIDTLRVDSSKVVKDSVIYTDVDADGKYIGGERALRKFVASNFKMPQNAIDSEISGLVIIQFIVEKNGAISNIKSLMPKEKTLGFGLEKECIRVINLTSGKWIPASRGGKPVRSYWRFPFEVDNKPWEDYSKSKKRKGR